MKLYIPSLTISWILTVVGALFKILHWPYASLILDIASLISLIFIILGISHLWKSKDKSAFMKISWTIGFLFLSGIVGAIYYFKEFNKKNELDKNHKLRRSKISS